MRRRERGRGCKHCHVKLGVGLVNEHQLPLEETAILLGDCICEKRV